MIELYKRLAERVHNEVSDLEREVKRAQKSWRVVPRTTDPDPYIDSVALNLHGFYSGVERLFELIANQIDEQLPSGEAWHRQLLDQMAHEIEGVRPPVIDASTVMLLDEFRKFRHLVRHVYTSQLDAARMQTLMDSLSILWAKLAEQLEEFANFLEELSRADEAR
ncbi:MAG: antitoxin [Chloroflexota bacterium]|nr:MAG: antitoxin [Chloroflexota bacterium]